MLLQKRKTNLTKNDVCNNYSPGLHDEVWFNNTVDIDGERLRADSADPSPCP